MRDFILVSYKMIRVDYDQFYKHFCLFHYVCLCLKTNQNDLSFAVNKFWKSNVKWHVLLRKESLFHASIRRVSKQLSPAKKSRRFARLSFRICRYIKEMICCMTVFKKNGSDIINECLWNSQSKQMNSFDYLCHIFYGK